MEAAESPLDVLSRAAVMIQRNVLPPPSYDEARSLTQQQNQKLQRKCKAIDLSNESDESAVSSVSSTYDKVNTTSGKWKRNKKYPHKTPIAVSVCDSSLSEYKSCIRLNGKNSENGSEPLDMSKRTITKDRGEPPSYFQSILCSNYGRRLPDVSAAAFPSNSEAKSTTPVSDDKETMCDQVINEHFRRSLGRDYVNVFSSSRTSSKNDRVEFSQSTLSKMHNEEDVDASPVAQNASPSALSVDDHFAKALGDTWIKLQQKEKRQTKNQNRKRTTDED